MIRDSNGLYSFYYFLSDGDAETGTPAWVNALAEKVDLTIPTGTGLWIYDSYNTDATYTVAGAVASDDSITVSYVGDYNLTANPYPIAINPNGDLIDWGALVGPAWDENDEWTTTAPQIMVRDDDGLYTFFYYLSDGDADTGTPAWVNAVADKVTTEVIPAGSAFWLKASEAISVVYKK